MTRVLVFGDLAQTGFGTVTLDLGKAMLDRGEDVRFASLNEGVFLDKLPEWLTGRVLRLGDAGGWLSPSEAAELVPIIEGIFGSAPWEDGWAPEASIIIGDVASVKLSPVPGFIPPGFPVFHYVPIEGIDLPPRWAAVWQWMKPVAMSEFGADQIQPLVGFRPPVIYHGVDTDTFHPASPEHPIVLRSETQLHVLKSRNDCKRFLGLDPNRILIFRADRNVPRKRYPSLLRCLAPVLARHPEADFVYHALTIDQGGDLGDDISKFRPEIAARMQASGFHDRRKSADRSLLVTMYNAADIYVSTSAEGFGLTIAEALACGTPAVAMDFSAVPEVVGKAGILVPPGFYDDNIYAHFWAGVDEPQFSAAVESLVTSRGKRRSFGDLGPIHVGAMFRWDRAAEQFGKLLAQREAVAAA